MGIPWAIAAGKSSMSSNAPGTYQTIFRTLTRVALLYALSTGPAWAAECVVAEMPSVIPAYKSPFSDGRTQVSRENMKKTAEIMRPLRQEISRELRQAEEGMVKHDEAKTRCALQTLVQWAKSGATSRMETGAEYSRGEKQQSLFEVKWMLVGKAFSYMYVKDAASPEERRLIENWLEDTAHYLGDIVLQDTGEFRSPTNNHLYWNGLALMAVGVATGDGALIKQARRTYEQGMDEITAEGLLPQEIARKNVALHYHGYAAAPLVLMAELSHKTGEDWYALHDGAIRRLLKTTIEGFKDPQAFGSKVGYPQDVRTFTKSAGTSGDMIWIPFAYAKYGSDFAPRLPIKPSYSYSYCGNVQQLIDIRFFDRQVPILKKARWWD